MSLVSYQHKARFLWHHRGHHIVYFAVPPNSIMSCPHCHQRPCFVVGPVLEEETNTIAIVDTFGECVNAGLSISEKKAVIYNLFVRIFYSNQNQGVLDSQKLPRCVKDHINHCFPTNESSPHPVSKL